MMRLTMANISLIPDKFSVVTAISARSLEPQLTGEKDTCSRRNPDHQHEPGLPLRGHSAAQHLVLFERSLGCFMHTDEPLGGP
jgi:hypothetical protein